MLKYRLFFGSIFSAILLTLLYLDGRLAVHWPYDRWSIPPGTLLALTMVVILPIGLFEMQGLLSRVNVNISLRICVVAAILCMIWPWLEQLSEQLRHQPHDPEAAMVNVGHWMRSVKPHYLVPSVLAATLVGVFFRQSWRARVEGAIASAGGSLFAVVYLGVLPGFFLPIRLTHGAWMVLWVVVMVKSADIGAYTVGRLIGKHKLAPWLSPGKSVEGFFGGLVVSTLVGIAVAAGTKHLAWPQGALMGFVLGAVGQMGDLLESLLKRDAGVKDSGRVPGFGGVLDLLDSPLLAAPVAYWMLKLLNPTGSEI